VLEGERPAYFTIACFEGPSIVPFALDGSSLLLLVKQEISVDDHAEPHTISYGYRLATGKAKQDWLIRWEYFRQRPKPDYPYPRAHVHINGELAEGGVVLPKLHIPTSRVPLELVLWHAIAEWGVTPKSEDWQAILEESMDSFEGKRRAR
jgi:hypothetical protein